MKYIRSSRMTGQQSTTVKLVELCNKILIGKYIRKEEGKFNSIFVILDKDGLEHWLYNSKSLHSYMKDSLLGKTLYITCVGLTCYQDGKIGGVASVEVGPDD